SQVPRADLFVNLVAINVDRLLIGNARHVRSRLVACCARAWTMVRSRRCDFGRRSDWTPSLRDLGSWGSRWIHRGPRRLDGNLQVGPSSGNHVPILEKAVRDAIAIDKRAVSAVQVHQITIRRVDLEAKVIA